MTAFAPNFSPEVDRDNAVPILASRFEELFALLVDAFANSLDNSTNETLGAPVGFNGQRLVSIANGQTPTDAATMDNLRSREGAYFIAAFNSVTNTYSVDFGPDYLQKIGTNIFVKFPTQNTEEAPLFQINGNAALPLFIDGFPVGLGGITAGMIANIIFADGAMHMRRETEYGQTHSEVSANITGNMPETGFYYNLDYLMRAFHILTGMVKLEINARGMLLIKAKNEIYFQAPIVHNVSAKKTKEPVEKEAA